MALTKTGRKLLKEKKSKEKKKWIQGMDMEEGAFTAKAKRHGMSVSEFRRHVLANKEDFDSKTVRQAVLAGTLTKIARSR